MVNTKTCTKCLKEKPLSEFYKRSLSKDNLSYQCKFCKDADAQEYARANKDSIIANKRLYYLANQVREIEASRCYQRKNPRKVKETKRIYYQKHRAKIVEKERVRYNTDTNYRERRIIHYQKRHACKRGLSATLTQEQWKMILQEWSYGCAYCGTSQDNLNEPLQQEHIIPLSQGGGYTLKNIVPACRKCNARKGGRTP